MYPYAIGLDIGIASVGWATVALDAEEKPCGILGMGSRIFDAAEQTDGKSLAALRREARGTRRRLRRHRHRNERLRSLMVSSGLVTKQELDTLFDGRLEDIYALRVRALDEKVSAREFARILLHISQRRGFLSNRKNASTDEDGLLLKAVAANKERMNERGYRTVGEMLLRDEAFAEYKRNKGGSYATTVSRDMITDEVKSLFAAQRALGSEYASDQFEENYLEILLSQRSFDEGPGGNSPYGGSQIEGRVGNCIFFPEEKRAARATYSFELCSLLQKVNHIRLISPGGESERLTDEQRGRIIELAHKSKDVSYAQIRKALGISDEQHFNIHYANDKTREESEKKAKLGCMKAYHQMRKAFGADVLAAIPTEQRNAIATALTYYKTSGKIRAYLEAAGIDSSIIDMTESIGNFAKFGHISIKACDLLIPQLQKGLNYNEACAAAGLNFKGHDGSEKSRFLHPTPDDLADITSPVVKRAVSQTAKVINAIIRKQGCSPTFINIELARELSKSKKERDDITHKNEENRKVNERLRESIEKDFGCTNPKGQDILKLRLYNEQGGICMYSLKPISAERLFETEYTEIDHIVPYSKSFDDRRANKVLVLTKENRDKGNRLPLEYLSGQRRDDFIVWVKNNVKDKAKLALLLKESFTKEDAEQFKERNLQDTKTMSRFLMNYIRDNLEFAESTTGRKNKVIAVSGAVTSCMRKRWGITKIREDGDLHHAVDAVVIACTTQSMIKMISEYSNRHEIRYMQHDGGSIAYSDRTGEAVGGFPHPWEGFRRELEARLANDPAKIISELRLPFYMDSGEPLPEPLFVSRMPMRKVTGAAHGATISSPKVAGCTVKKMPLDKLKLDKDGEIVNYYDPDSDRLLYNALKARLAEYGGDANKAFAEPFHKPKSDGSEGPIVKKVKLCEKQTMGVPVNGGRGIAANDSMVRVDVFRMDGKYFLVPIYVADTLKPELPNKAIVQAKPYSEWPEMSDDDFIFSLHKNDLMSITNNRGIKLTLKNKNSTREPPNDIKSCMLYYVSTDVATGAIRCISHDGAFECRIGTKTLDCFEKYEVDVLGEYHKVEKEKRVPFNIKKNK